MRWLIRRTCFYAFALWVAVTLNFLLPRLMPGDPAGGMLARLNPAQIQSNPGIIETYRRMLGGGHQSWFDSYISYLGQIAHLDFGVSTSNYPTEVSEVSRGRCRIRSSSSASPSSSRSSSARRSA